MTTIPNCPLALTAAVAVTLSCSGNEKISRSGARTPPTSGGPGTVLAKLPLRARNRGELPE
jgi:hypothetical protein